MSAAKKRKIDNKGRAFNSEWCTKYFVAPHNVGAVCLVCQSKFVKRHYTTKHSFQFVKVVSEARVDKIEHLKKSIDKEQSVFTTYKKNSELVTKLSFKLCE